MTCLVERSSVHGDSNFPHRAVADADKIDAAVSDRDDNGVLRNYLTTLIFLTIRCPLYSML
ncbi:MAG: hypothetical protein IKX13_06650 [Bacteroidales bacterium]|nr:hypothetical protein [Bacteroidales bacterium]